MNVVIPKCKVTNFSESWNNGLALSALVDYCKPGLIPNHVSLNPSNGLENIKNAMDIAEKELGVPQVMHPEDMAVEKPDDLSVMTYVSGFSRQDSAGQKSLLIWINQQIPHHQVTNLSSDWTDGLALGALTDVLSGGQLPEYEELNKESPVENCRKVMYKAEVLLEIELTTTPEEFASGSLNQLSRVSYLAQFQACKRKSLTDSLTVTGSGVTGGTVGQRTTFTVSAGRIPKWAVIHAKVTTPAGKEVEAKKESKSDSSVEFSYIPEEPGEYIIEIDMNDTPLPGFRAQHIIPTHASKCRAAGDGLKRACVGKRAEFSVDCEQGGVGELQVTVQGPQDKLPVTSDETKQQNYDISYTPEEVGIHEITISWGEEQIPESPFQSAVTDPSKCRVNGLAEALVNISQTFTVNTSDAGPGELSVKSQSPNGEIPVTVIKAQPQEYSCSYTPKEPGEHIIDIFWSNQPIAKSPFRVNAIIPIYTSKCRASGDGLKRACVGKRAEFSVDCEQGGVGELQVTVQGPQDKLPLHVEETKPKNFQVSYTPEEVGIHEVKIDWGEEPIPESPFQSAITDPSRCTVSGVTEAYVNIPQTFTVDTSSAGPGELSVKCRGPSDEILVEVSKQQNKTYLCNFTPQETGEYVIDIYWSDNAITESPLHINAIVPTYISKCRASGDGLKRGCVGKRAEFSVDCEQGGVGELQVTVQGPHDKLPVTIDETAKSKNFQVSYTPKNVGTHEITVCWGNEQLPESPFQSAVTDPSKCKLDGQAKAHVNVSQTFTVDTSDAGPGVLSVKCQGPVSEIPVEVSLLQNETYSCNYTPQDSGEHVFDIYWSDQPIAESPFRVNAFVPIYTSKCRASGDGLKRGCVGKRAEFSVDCEQGGVGELQVTVQGPQDKLPVAVNETKPKNYNVSFTPQVVGTHQIAINWGSEQIPESPFQSAVTDPSKCKASGDGLAQAHVKVPQTFTVDTSDAGPGVLSVKCQGPVSEIPVEVSLLQNKTYSCNYTPQDSGEHVFDIYWSDQPIAESPFQVNAFVPIYTNKCRASGDGLKRACVGKRAEFSVDCEQGGVGELQVTVQGPHNQLPVTKEETDKPQHFHVSYTPEEVGAHEITICWGDEQIPESPFQSAVTDPSKCSVSGLAEAHVNVPQTFTVDTSSAGPGELSMKCQSPCNSEIPVKISKQQNETYSCNFTPLESGEHVFDISWSDQPLTDSPFRVNAVVPTYPSKCAASGEGLKRACVGKKADFSVDCEQGGVGELQVTVQGPHNQLPVTKEETDKLQHFHVSYTPEEVGAHEITICWGDEQIPESPFQSAVTDPSKCSVTGLAEAHVNVPQAFTVDTSSAGPGELSVKCQSPSGEIPVEISKQQNETYSCNFTPLESGEHVLDISWSDQPLAGSPFRVNAVVPTYPSKCAASGEGLKRACVGKKAEFSVDCEQGGVGELQVTVQGPQDKLPVAVNETKPKNYDVSFTPQEVGAHDITINWGDEQIPESPFQSAVTDPSKCKVNGDGLAQAHVKVPQTFTVDTSDAGPGVLSVKCQGPVSEIPVEVSLLQNETYSCNYTPQDSGEHVFDIYWSDQPIAESPFRVNAFVPIYTSKCRASGDGLKRGCVGKRAEFSVDCEQGGVGELQVTVQGPQDKLPVAVNETKPKNYNVSFTPQVVGTHQIAINWGSEQIPESPFHSSVTDPSKCKASGDGLAQAHVKVPQTFTVDTSDAGPGVLSVKCQGPVSEIPVEVSLLQNKTYSCNYTPQDSGEHVFDIYWSDQPIAESPFQVNAFVPIYTNKCRASGDGLKRACVGKRAEFSVDCEQGGVGELQVTVQGPHNQLPVTKEETDKPQHFHVSYTPEEVGAHEITICWGDEQIPESPFQSAVTDPSKCSVSGLAEAHVNVPQTFTVDTSSAGPGELSVKCQNPSGEIPVEISKQQNETYSCNFTPLESGEHVLDISWSDQPLAGSPFRVNAVVPTYPSKCAASGEGLKRACVGKKADFSVDCEQGGVGELQVTVQGPHNQLPISKKETDKLQHFHVSYTPEEVGAHEITICWGDEQIPESPFQSAVTDPSKCSVTGLAEAHVNVPQTFTVDTSSAGPGELSVKCQSPSGEIPVEISKQQNETYSCNFTPLESGEHVFDISWSDQPLAGSPFRVNAVVPTYPSKCAASGEGLKRACVGKKAEFSVDCEQGGVGELQVTVQGPQDKLPVAVNETKPNNYDVSFTPQEVGAHQIAINWGSEQIPESPFQSAVTDPSKCKASGDGLAQAHVNVPQTFTVDTSDAGPGELSVKCQGPVSEIPVEVSLLQNKTYSCNYTPQDSGEHVFDIDWSDQPIAESPFQVNAFVPIYTNKCRASGDGLKRASVGKRAEFSVDCEQGGVGELQVKVQGPHNQLPVTKEETDKPQHFHVSYTPEEVGAHEITICWGDEQIPESPFQSAVTDPSKCTVSGDGLAQAHVKVPQTFTVDTNDAGPGELSVKCQGPSGDVPVEVIKMLSNTYSCTYTPQESGEYLLNILWSDDLIPKSPFQIIAFALADSNKCLITDLPKGDLYVGTTYSFNVVTRQPDHEYNLVVSAKDGGAIGSCEVDCNSMTGICAVHFTPAESGPLTLDVTCNGKSIPSTPVPFNIIDLSKPVEEASAFQVMQNIEETINFPEDLLPAVPNTETVDLKKTNKDVEDLAIEIGEPLTIIIDLESGLMSKEITAIATGQNTDPIDVPVVKNADNTITLCFSASKPDHYSIELKANGESIPTGPFNVTFIEPKKPRESQSTSWVPEEDTAERVSFKFERRNVNAQIKLSMDSSLVEASDTAISVQEASTAKPIASSLSEPASGEYNLEFTTTDEQEYTVVLTYLLKVSPSSGSKLQMLGKPLFLTSDT